MLSQCEPRVDRRLYFHRGASIDNNNNTQYEVELVKQCEHMLRK